MKYKNIKSAAHNFSQSFVSGMNYVDDDLIINDLKKCAARKSGFNVSVQWLPEAKVSRLSLTPRIRKSIKYYKTWLPKHLQSHGVVVSMIKELRTDIHLFKGRHLVIQSYARDSRGREYVQAIKF